MRNYAISCDWLQVYTENLNDISFNLTGYNSTKYTFIKENMSSRQFRDIYNVYNLQGEHYANIQCAPFSSIISEKAAIIKLSNRELYRIDFATTFINFLDRYKFKYKSISRIDVCYDFNSFCQGMKPRRLINTFLSKKILKNNQGNYQLMGSTSQINDYSYIRFGTRSSAVCSYMYDKTKEFKDVKDKPYIRELWKLNGIDDSQEVWRVEISIKSDMQNLVSMENGDVFRLHANDITTQKDIESVFFIYAKKYFAFKHNDGTKNKSRMKDVILFNRINEVTRRPIRVTSCLDTTRSDRIFLKKLHAVGKELRDDTGRVQKAVNEIRIAFSVQHSLSEYYYDKVSDEPKPTIKQIEKADRLKEIHDSEKT